MAYPYLIPLDPSQWEVLENAIASLKQPKRSGLPGRPRLADGFRSLQRLDEPLKIRWQGIAYARSRDVLECPDATRDMLHAAYSGSVPGTLKRLSARQHVSFMGTEFERHCHRIEGAVWIDRELLADAQRAARNAKQRRYNARVSSARTVLRQVRANDPHRGQGFAAPIPSHIRPHYDVESGDILPPEDPDFGEIAYPQTYDIIDFPG